MNIWVCVASGPSLAFDDYADLHYARSQGWKLATVNMGVFVAPDAKIFHAFDGDWWERYYIGGRVFRDGRRATECHGELWSGNHAACCRHPELRRLNTKPEGGWSTTPGKAHFGGLSGYQLIQIVGWQNPDLIILLGYDMQHTGGKAHHHPDYQDLRNAPNLERQVKHFATMAEQATVPIINCSRETALTCFPQATIHDAAAYAKAREVRPAVC